MNQKHRGVAGVLVNPSRPRTGPEGAAEATDAMASGRELTAHAAKALEAMKRETKSTGGERRVWRCSPRRKSERRRLGDGGSRGGRTAEPVIPRRGGYLGHGRREREKGVAGSVGKGSAPF